MHPLRKRLKRMRDPSMTGALRAAYGSNLDGLFLSFKADMKKVLGLREHEEPNEFAVSLLEKKLIASINANITIPAERIVRVDIKKAYTTGAIRSIQFLNAMGVTYTYTQLPADTNVIAILEARNLTELKGITDAMSQKIMRSISDGVMDGKGAEAIARDIDETVDGIGRTRARLLARTETMTAFNRAASNQYTKMGITEVEWLNGGDPCEECDAHGGQRYPIDDHPDIPVHPNCVCVLLPVIPEIE